MNLFDVDEFGIEMIIDTVVILGEYIWELKVIISDDDFFWEAYHAAIQVF